MSGTRAGSCAEKVGCLSPPKPDLSLCLPRDLPPPSPAISSPCALTQAGKRCCPLCQVSGTSRGRGIWHMNHSPSWEINYSSKPETKHFTNCPEREELGTKGVGEGAGVRLDTASIHERKRRKERGKKILSGVIKVLLGFWTWSFLFAGLSLQDNTPCSGSGSSRITPSGCSDSTFVLQISYPFPQASLPVQTRRTGEMQVWEEPRGAAVCMVGQTPVGPAPQTTRACSTSIFSDAAAASACSRVPLPSLEL